MANHLFMTDAEIADALGIKTADFKEKAIVLQRDGFPLPDPLFERRRYWPAVRAWLDRRYDLESQLQRDNPVPHERDGVEKW
nr:MAG TPA: Redirecting phage packaging protein C packaging protein, DNA Binding.0A [Caudoviricetes sp.]